MLTKLGYITMVNVTFSIAYIHGSVMGIDIGWIWMVKTEIDPHDFTIHNVNFGVTTHFTKIIKHQ